MWPNNGSTDLWRATINHTLSIHLNCLFYSHAFHCHTTRIDSHVLQMRASLLIYSHEFACIENFQRFLFHSFDFSTNNTIWQHYDSLEQNGWLHTCVFRCMWIWAKRRKDKQGEKRSKPKKKKKKKEKEKKVTQNPKDLFDMNFKSFCNIS